MRRTHGYNYDSLSADNGIKEENNELTSGLENKIAALKTISIDIGNEVRHHNRLLRDMDDDFDKTDSFLGKTMNRVIRLSRGRHNYYMCYLLLFAAAVFFILYIFIKVF